MNCLSFWFLLVTFGCNAKGFAIVCIVVFLFLFLVSVYGRTTGFFVCFMDCSWRHMLQISFEYTGDRLRDKCSVNLIFRVWELDISFTSEKITIAEVSEHLSHRYLAKSCVFAGMFMILACLYYHNTYGHQNWQSGEHCIKHEVFY